MLELKGLMQLMPYTAKKVSQGLRLSYSKQKLTEDPKYNVILGSAYLGHSSVKL